MSVLLADQSRYNAITERMIRELRAIGKETGLSISVNSYDLRLPITVSRPESNVHGFGVSLLAAMENMAKRRQMPRR